MDHPVLLSRPARLLAVSLALVAGAAARADSLGVGLNYNLGVGGNLTFNGGSVGGRALVGGNANFTSSSSVGTGQGQSNTRDDLLVAGTLNNSSGNNWQVQANVAYGTAFTGAALSYNSPGAGPRQVSPFQVNGANGNAVNSGGQTVASIVTDLQNRSGSWAAAADQGVVTKSQAFGTLTLTGNNSALNVFNVNPTLWNNSGFLSVNLTAPAGSTVLVNILGQIVNTGGVGINLTGVTANRVLFNFADTTGLSFSTMNLNGSLLAPYASGTVGSGNLNGIGLWGGNLTVTSVGFNNTGFAGDLPPVTPIPEPDTWLAGVGVLLLAGAATRRRRNPRPVGC
jgi:choice-of-anchor A domain-containing protein/MYXO-CTERM domain-containing protein